MQVQRAAVHGMLLSPLVEYEYQIGAYAPVPAPVMAMILNYQFMVRNATYQISRLYRPCGSRQEDFFIVFLYKFM